MTTMLRSVCLGALLALSACGGGPGPATGGGEGGGSAVTGGGNGTTGGGSATTGGGDGTTGGGTATTGGGDGTTGGGTATTGGGDGTTGGGTATTGGGTATTGGGTGTTGGGSGTACVDLCAQGSSICDPAGVRTCQLDNASGCRVFGPAQACSGGTTCSGGVCQASCVNQCTAGAAQCASTGAPVTCQQLSNGCTDWVLQSACASGQVCSGGTCVGSTACTNQCTAGATRCTAGGQQQTCMTLSSGCTEWSLPVACTSGQTCAAPATSCAVVRCTAGDRRCSSAQAAVETCDVNGNWVVSAQCPQACSNAQCTAAASCQPGTVRCNGADVEGCNAQGTAWLYRQSCSATCSAGVCTGNCTAGEQRCNGNVPETCNAGGTAWTAAQSCANGCYRGGCMENDLVIDGVTTTLEGDLKYANNVIIRNQGQLRVGPSGNLKLTARNITVEANTTINANDLGEDTRGEGGASSCCSYTSSGICRCTLSGNRGASYGTEGAAASLSGYCSYYGSTRSCTLSTAPVYDRDDDLSISEGSVLNANKAGGVVQLVAETVRIDGQITANANNAGASGGGVLVAANSLTGTGVIQTSGASASPAGGNGRVKLLRGVTTNLFSGSIVGNNRTTVMPPLDVVSGSHPDANRWYNDGVGDWYLAWTKPFPTLTGYYFKVGTSVSTLPSNMSGNGTFHQTESHVVPASELVPGANYFHIVSVDSAFDVGTIKATARMNLNTTPPTITSPSHSAERTWNGSNALYFQWTNPRADENFTGYYYVLDNYGDTVPPATQSNFTSNKQVLLANTPPGVWVMHLINRDTRGATTKAADHYVVYVGAEPAEENISGTSFDGSNNNAPLSGVTITVNRGLFNTTTAANGTYTFGGNLYVGTWELTASKAGYLPVRRTVTLTAGAPLNENFTLTREP